MLRAWVYGIPLAVLFALAIRTLLTPRASRLCQHFTAGRRIQGVKWSTETFVFTKVTRDDCGTPQDFVNIVDDSIAYIMARTNGGDLVGTCHATKLKVPDRSVYVKMLRTEETPDISFADIICNNWPQLLDEDPSIKS